MLLFGPATVTVDGENLGDTYGGVSVSPEYFDPKTIGEEELICVGGSGEINLYSLPPTEISGSAELYSGELVFSGDNYTLTFYNAWVFLGDSFSTGTFNQEAVPLTFKFRPDSTGKIFKME